MRKIVSILLVVLLLINASGYYLISIGLFIHDKEQSLKLLNGEYSGSDAIIIKLPLSLPYSTNDNTYETAEGKFLFNKETYRIVKKKIINDTVLIVCVKDHIDSKIRIQMSNLANSQTDLPQNHKQISSSLSFVKDYLPTSCTLGNNCVPWTIEIGYESIQHQYTFLFESLVLQPPQA
jgi:hypothetical protein